MGLVNPSPTWQLDSKTALAEVVEHPLDTLMPAARVKLIPVPVPDSSGPDHSGPPGALLGYKCPSRTLNTPMESRWRQSGTLRYARLPEQVKI